ncbi:MAG: hypothetical protein JXN60_02015, partial [Lentisphaerae bacterium]|nr:hypothetical protein [Lentisphaerota bacterium]
MRIYNLLRVSFVGLCVFAEVSSGAQPDGLTTTLNARTLTDAGNQWHAGIALWQTTGAGEWQIEGDMSDGTAFRSHLEWNDLNSTMVVLHGDFPAFSRIKIFGSCGFGIVTGGSNTDSDYFLSADHASVVQQFSRSVSDSEGDTFYFDLNAAWQWFPFFRHNDNLFVSDLFCGFFVFQCGINDSDGVQTVMYGQSVNEPFPGKNATYDFMWKAEEVGIRCYFRPDTRLSIAAEASMLVNAYQDGEGFWMLRNDLSPNSPNIRNNSGAGFGNRLSFSVIYRPWQHVR